MPLAAERVWTWFWSFDRTRNGNGYQPNRLTHHDIAVIAGDRASQWEIDALLAMDSARLRAWHSEHSDGEGGSQQFENRELTPDLFDALFD